jgi:hypothetical protein
MSRMQNVETSVSEDHGLAGVPKLPDFARHDAAVNDFALAVD